MSGWSAALRVSLVRRTLSISGLEHFAALMAVKMRLDEWEDLGMPARETGMQIIARCDDEPACFVAK